MNWGWSWVSGVIGWEVISPTWDRNAARAPLSTSVARQGTADGRHRSQWHRGYFVGVKVGVPDVNARFGFANILQRSVMGANASGGGACREVRLVLI